MASSTGDNLATTSGDEPASIGVEECKCDDVSRSLRKEGSSLIHVMSLREQDNPVFQGTGSKGDTAWRVTRARVRG